NADLARSDHDSTKVVAGNRSAGSLRQTVCDAGDTGGPVEALLDAAGHDPHDTPGPGRAPDQPNRVPRPRLRFRRTERISKDRLLTLLSLAIDRIERCGERCRLHCVLAQQQTQPQVSFGDPARRIDAWAKRETAGAGGGTIARLRDLEQCGYPRARTA